MPLLCSWITASLVNKTLFQKHDLWQSIINKPTEKGYGWLVLAGMSQGKLNERVDMIRLEFHKKTLTILKTAWKMDQRRPRPEKKRKGQLGGYWSDRDQIPWWQGQKAVLIREHEDKVQKILRGKINITLLNVGIEMAESVMISRLLTWKMGCMNSPIEGIQQAEQTLG